LQDQTFDQSCIKAVGQIETSFEEEQDIKALINSIENISEREKELYSLYYEVMTQYSQDMTDIVYLTNEYLKRIESSDEFIQKERIYFALTIAVNSAHYWQEFDL
jgi:DNA-directed RNA polymerase specialized sigma subunit